MITDLLRELRPDPQTKRNAGRPRKYSDDVIYACAEAANNGRFAVADLAKKIGVHRTTVYRWAKHYSKTSEDPLKELSLKERRKKVGYVYFVFSPDAKLIKIGNSANHPDSRLAKFRTGSPVVLDRLGFIRGGPQDETRLHARFRHLRVHGEWFRAEEELLAYIKSHASLWDVRIPSSKEDHERAKCPACSDVA